MADSGNKFNEALLDFAEKIKTGNGLNQATTMGPVYAVTGLFLMAASITGEGIFTPTVHTTVTRPIPLRERRSLARQLTVNESHSLDAAIEVLSKSAFGNSAAI